MVDHRDRAPREPGMMLSPFVQAVMKVAFALGVPFGTAMLIVASMGTVEFP